MVPALRGARKRCRNDDSDRRGRRAGGAGADARGDCDGAAGPAMPLGDDDRAHDPAPLVDRYEEELGLFADMLVEGMPDEEDPWDPDAFEHAYEAWAMDADADGGLLGDSDGDDEAEAPPPRAKAKAKAKTKGKARAAQADAVDGSQPRADASAGYRGGRGGRGDGPGLERFPLPDMRSDIRLDRGQNTVSAHCIGCGHNSCRMERTLKRATGSGKRSAGRPLGPLIAWLRRGPECDSRSAHKAVQAELSFEERRTARRYGAALPELQELFELDRSPRASEAPEPEGMV